MAKRESITHHEYLQLLGLAVIAKQGYEQVTKARDAIHSVLGTTEEGMEDGGNIGDMVWNGEAEVDRMLKRMEIIVLPQPEAIDAIR